MDVARGVLPAHDEDDNVDQLLQQHHTFVWAGEEAKFGSRMYRSADDGALEGIILPADDRPARGVAAANFERSEELNEFLPPSARRSIWLLPEPTTASPQKRSIRFPEEEGREGWMTEQTMRQTEEEEVDDDDNGRPDDAAPEGGMDDGIEEGKRTKTKCRGDQ
uniref:Uncharacterized protein n=1 Tax=Globodera rostochiensis TaxID=31243 RepID=A0A914H2M1_GLORO